MTFTCIDCKQDKLVETSGGTGYANTDKGKVCYACCAIRDATYMREHGRIDLYWNGKMVTNWPGTLQIPPVAVRKGRHNMGGQQTTVYFRSSEGHPWSGRHTGNWGQILRCKRISERAFNRR